MIYLILKQWTKFQCHTFFPSQDIKQDVLLSSYLDSQWNNLYHNGWQGEKEEKTEIQKFEYLENGKSTLDEIINIFYSFWRAIIWLKINFFKKIADTNFKICLPNYPSGWGAGFPFLGPIFKSAAWLQDRGYFSLSSCRSWLNEYEELLETGW